MFGQLQRVHRSVEGENVLDVTIDDYNITYKETHWTSDKKILLKLLYLGVPAETLFITPFFAELNTSGINGIVKPTLSPKDPAFPAWWEQHKTEWEV